MARRSYKACPRVLHTGSLLLSPDHKLNRLIYTKACYGPIRIIFPFTREISRLLLISTLRIPDVTTFQSHSFRTFVTHLPAFTTSSHPHATLLFYPASELSRLSTPILPY